MNITNDEKQVSELVTVTPNIYSIAHIIKYIYEFDGLYKSEKLDLKLCKIGKSIIRVKIQIFHRVCYQALLYEIERIKKLPFKEQVQLALIGKDVSKFKDYLSTYWTLIFDTLRDGDRASTFHSMCDNKLNTLIVININGRLIGGFTKLSWDGNGIWKEDREAFLFSVELGKVIPIDKGFGNAIYCSNRHGPIFGSGYDLRITDSCTSNKYNYVDKKNYGTLDESLDGKFYLTGGEAYFQVTSYQVYIPK